MRWTLAVGLALLGGCGLCQPQQSPRLPPEMQVEAVERTPPPTPQPSQRPPVIDAHTHIGGTSYDLAMRIADEEGLARIINLSGGHQGRKHGLTPHLKAIDRYPGRVAVFYNVAWDHIDDPRFGEVIAQGLSEAVSRGYAGLKIPKALGLGVTDKGGAFVPVDDPRLDPIWARAGELGVPVSIHTSDPKAFFEPLTPDNERYEELEEAPDWSFADKKYPRRDTLLAQRDRLLARHPNTTFILVHFGNNPEDIDYVDRLLDTYPNAHLDVAARLGEFGRHDPKKVRALFIKHRARILFGTDLGVHTRNQGDEKVYSLFLGSRSKEPPTLASVSTFFDRHWRYFEADPALTPEIPHPIPIQGSWQVHPINLPKEVIQALYHDNAYRLVFAPLYKRLGIADPLGSDKGDTKGDIGTR